GGDSVSRRAVVSGRRKSGLLLRAGLSLWPGRALLEAPPLPANRPLLAAVAATEAPPQTAGKVDFVIDLFERLERRERQTHFGRSPA
ncbi:hypothetical protein PO768_15295, partial [Paucibacter sp. XJ19-41]|nr:hypothetical protein [Paucibacter sp. XJ19-41]